MSARRPALPWIVAGLAAALFLALGAVAAVLFLAGADSTTVASPDVGWQRPLPHSVERGEPALPAVPGYTYSDLTGTAGQELGDQFAATMEQKNRLAAKAAPGLGPLYTSWSIHQVYGDDYVGYLFLLDLNQRYFTQGLITDEQVLLFEIQTMRRQGVTGERVTVAGQEMVAFSGPESTGLVWYTDGYEYTVIGDDLPTVRAFVEEFLKVS